MSLYNLQVGCQPFVVMEKFLLMTGKVMIVIVMLYGDCLILKGCNCQGLGFVTLGCIVDAIVIGRLVF